MAKRKPDPESLVRLAGIDLDRIDDAVAAAMIKLAAGGNVGAAQVVVQLVETARRRHDAAEATKREEAARRRRARWSKMPRIDYLRHMVDDLHATAEGSSGIARIQAQREARATKAELDELERADHREDASAARVVSELGQLLTLPKAKGGE